VGDNEGFPDEQTVRAVWSVETRRQAANAGGVVVEVKKSVYSPI
jgi:hypothetical protein